MSEEQGIRGSADFHCRSDRIVHFTDAEGKKLAVRSSAVQVVYAKTEKETFIGMNASCFLVPETHDRVMELLFG